MLEPKLTKIESNIKNLSAVFFFGFGFYFGFFKWLGGFNNLRKL